MLRDELTKAEAELEFRETVDKAVHQGYRKGWLDLVTLVLSMAALEVLACRAIDQLSFMQNAPWYYVVVEVLLVSSLAVTPLSLGFRDIRRRNTPPIRVETVVRHEGLPMPWEMPEDAKCGVGGHVFWVDGKIQGERAAMPTEDLPQEFRTAFADWFLPWLAAAATKLTPGSDDVLRFAKDDRYFGQASPFGETDGLHFIFWEKACSTT